MFYCWFGLYIQISYYTICLEAEKMCFPENFQKHNQTPEIIFIYEKYFHLKIFYTLKSFYIEPNVALVAKHSFEVSISIKVTLETNFR